jgi:hypothetical protein
MSERISGYEIRGSDGKWHEFLTAGKRYRVIQQFIDSDRGIHLPGDQWVFLGYSIVVYDDINIFVVSVDGAGEMEIEFHGGNQAEVLSHLDKYLAPVTSEPYVAPVARETSLAPVTNTPERIAALVKSAFADMRGIDGKLATKGIPEGPPGPPGTIYVPQVTPPLPVPWPAERVVYYAYARCHLGAAVEDVSEPWARIESGSEPVLVPLSGQLKWLGRQGVKVATVGQRLIFEETARAGPLEDLLLSAASNDATAALVRRSYCSWQRQNLIAKAVLPWHADFAAFLDCAHVAIEPVPRPQPGTLIQPEFNRRWLQPKGRPDIWELVTTNGFPSEWPAGPKAKITYYAAAIRYDKTLPAPRPWEVTEPWGMVVREGYDGALAFTSLTSEPKSLGIEPAKARSASFFPLLRKIRDVLDARHQSGIDELFLPAAQDPQLAALVGSWFKQWVEDNSLLSSWVLPRHAAFAAFINSASQVTLGGQSNQPSGLVKNFY